MCKYVFSIGLQACPSDNINFRNLNDNMDPNTGTIIDFNPLQRGMSESYPMFHASVIFDIILLINAKIDSGNNFYQSFANPMDN